MGSVVQLCDSMVSQKQGVASWRKGAVCRPHFFLSRVGGKAFPGFDGGKIFQPDYMGFTYKVNGIGNLQLAMFNIQVTNTHQQLVLSRCL